MTFLIKIYKAFKLARKKPIEKSHKWAVLRIVTREEIERDLDEALR